MAFFGSSTRTKAHNYRFYTKPYRLLFDKTFSSKNVRYSSQNTCLCPYLAVFRMVGVPHKGSGPSGVRYSLRTPLLRRGHPPLRVGPPGTSRL